jgi:hypothetical protein
MSSRTKWDKYYTALERAKSLNDLPEPLITLLSLTSLLIDIEFKKNGDKSLDWNHGRSYRAQDMKEALPDQLTPADRALEGSQQELFG